MKAWILSVGVLMYAATSVRAHGVLIEPPARTGMGKETGTGKKLVGETTFRNDPANGAAGDGCGSLASTGNPGPQAVSVTWTAGENAKICWEITIPHAEDTAKYGSSPGVRVSIAYSATDRFDTDVLVSGVDGGPLGTYCTTVKLPAAKSCPQCVLQWSWVSLPDGGAYVGCADIKVNPQTNNEICQASIWMNAVGDCTASGMYNMDAILNHGGGRPAIEAACGRQATLANWLNKGAHSGYQNTILQKQDINYNNQVAPRLGPAANCPQGAQTPPLLPNPPVPPPGGQPAPGQPGPAPGQPIVQPPPLAGQPICVGQPPVCNCGSNSRIVEHQGTILPYPVISALQMQGDETKVIPCAQANAGYEARTGTHTGFQVKCNKGTGKLEIGLQGGNCAAYPKCSSIQAQAALVCGTLTYDQSRASMPYRQAADCCASPGGAVPGQPIIGQPGQPIVGQPGQPIGQLPISGDVCASLTCVSMMMFQGVSAQCDSRMMQGGTNVIVDSTCRMLSAGGSNAGYYQLSCSQGTIKGLYGCSDPTCDFRTCASTNFELLTSDLNRCVAKPFDCKPGIPGDCLTNDFMFNTQMCSANSANTWAVSALGAAIPVAALAMTNP